jgi:putative flippase GtrA
LITSAPWEQKLPGPDAAATDVADTPHAADGAAQGRPRGLSAQLPWFIAIGVASTLAYLLLYWVLRGFMPAQAANALSLLVTAIANTSANRRLTFGVRGSEGATKHQIQGLIAFAAGLALSSGALACLHAVSATPGRVVELAALIVANLAATALRFVLFRLWVFGKSGANAA